MRAKYKMLSETTVVVDVDSRAASRKKLAGFVKEWGSRKRAAMNILGPILENCPLPKKALLEDIGMETDEDASVAFPPP